MARTKLAKAETTKAPAPKHKTRRAKTDDPNFRKYIYSVLKAVAPDTGISGDAHHELNLITLYLLKKFVNAANHVVAYSKKKTISSRDIQTSVRLILPGELAKHAITEGTKAVTKFFSNDETGPTKRAKNVRAGLSFSVPRVSKVIRVWGIRTRNGAGAAVYLTGVVEYLIAEILEIASQVARDHKKKRITPRHIKLAVLLDSELNRLFRDTILPGGVVPFIHEFLLPAGKKAKE